MPNFVQTHVSSCGCFHLDKSGNKLYPHPFKSVLPFHLANQLQLAPVTNNDGEAYHITTDGKAAYTQKFDKTFGFYDGYASVIKDKQWFHITSTGSALYSERYTFTGNFQQQICVVCDIEDNYFHIDIKGEPLYTDKWKYCGDFRERIAVVQNDHGVSTHINQKGRLLHDLWFDDLDIFHKGFARAKDDQGWHHINKQGQAIYDQRYTNIEPFYNGLARVESFSGKLSVINEDGSQVRGLRPETEVVRDDFTNLSADMVGYWKTFTIATMVELKIADYLPNSLKNLTLQIHCDHLYLKRLLNACAELELVKNINHQWHLTKKGKYLQRNHPLSLATAALEYQDDLLKRWYGLSDAIKGKEIAQNIFQDVSKDSGRCISHHRMLRSYALHDYTPLIDLLSIDEGDTVFDAAGGDGALSEHLASHFSEASIVLGDKAEVIQSVSSTKFKTTAFDLFSSWPLKANKIILARVLHDWSDAQAITILKEARQSLKSEGKILIIEMLLSENTVSGSLCDLHLLAVTGGKERTQQEFSDIVNCAGLSLLKVKQTPTLVSILEVGHV